MGECFLIRTVIHPASGLYDPSVNIKIHVAALLQLPLEKRIRVYDVDKLGIVTIQLAPGRNREKSWHGGVEPGNPGNLVGSQMVGHEPSDVGT